MTESPAELETFRYDEVVILKRRTPPAEFAEETYHGSFDYPEHDHKKAYFMLTGHRVYKEKLGSKTFHHRPFSLLWRPPEISHADSMEAADGRSFCVYVNDDTLRRLADCAAIPSEFVERNTYLVHLAQRLRSEFRNWTAGSELVSEGLVLEMLGYAARQKASPSRTPPAWVVKVAEKLEDEFEKNHTNVKLALEFGVHPVHLARTFRKFYGKSVGTCLREIRVERAAALMLESQRSLAEIAQLSGFSDQSQFTRAFKRVRGITPGAFMGCRGSGSYPGSPEEQD